jgi:hypothetical protein
VLISEKIKINTLPFPELLVVGKFAFVVPVVRVIN